MLWHLNWYRQHFTSNDRMAMPRKPLRFSACVLMKLKSLSLRARRRRRSRLRWMLLESLERRQLLASDWSVAFAPGSAGTLQVYGDDSANAILISRSSLGSDQLSVQINNHAPALFALSSVGELDVRGFGGDDKLTIDVSNGHIPIVELGRTVFDGGEGADQVIVRDANHQATISNATPPDGGIGIVVLGGTPGTWMRFRNTESLLSQLTGSEVAIANRRMSSGDSSSVFLPGDNGNFTLESFSAVVGGQAFPLQRTILANTDQVLSYQGTTIARVITRGLGDTFANTGVLNFNPNATGDNIGLLDGSSTLRGFQGTIRVQYLDGNQPRSIDLEIVPGVSPSAAFDDMSNQVQIALLQQRLNYFGFQDSANSNVTVDGLFGPSTVQALQRFKADAVRPALDPQTQNSEIDAVTAKRLNGVATSPPNSPTNHFVFQGDAGNNTIQVGLDANDPQLLSVRIDGNDDTKIPITRISTLTIQGLDGNDTLVFDASHGNLPMLEFGRFIFDGGLGSDWVVIKDASGVAKFSSAQPPIKGEGHVELAGSTGTSIRYRGTEFLVNQIGSKNEFVFSRILSTGDSSSVVLNPLSTDPFVIDSYQLVEPSGLKALTAITDEQGDVFLTYDEQQIASVSFVPAAVGVFGIQGAFRFNPQTADSANEVDADLTAPGFQGTVRVNYHNGTESGAIDLVVVPGYTPMLPFSGSTQPGDVMQLQQRLNYWGALDANGDMLVTDGIVSARLNEAIQTFKATSRYPETNLEQQSTVITPATANRLNGLGILPRQPDSKVLNLVGDEGNNIFRLSLDPSDPGQVLAQVDGRPVERVSLQSLNTIAIYGRDGSDTIVVDTSFGSIPLFRLDINGGEGNDTLILKDTTSRSRIIKSNYGGDYELVHNLLVEPFPNTKVDHKHVETIRTDFNGNQQTLTGPVVGTGDALGMRLPGSPNKTFVMDSFQLLAGGQVITLNAVRNAQTGDLQLFSPSGGSSRLIATIVHNERLQGDKFSQSGFFAIAFNASEDDLPLDTSTAPGFQGQLRINYRNGATIGQVDIKAVPGFWSGYEFRASDGVYRNLVLQQRLNYLGYTSSDGLSLQVNGIWNTQTEQALRKFKADIVSPALDPNLQSVDIDPITVRRLNGLASNELTSELQGLLAESLRAVSDQLSKLESTGPLATLLPLIGTTDTSAVAADPTSGVTLAQLAAFRSTLVNDVFAPLSAYLLTDNTPSAAEFTNFTQNQSNPPTFRQLQVQTVGNMTEYKVDLIRTGQTTRGYNPGTAAQLAGIELMSDTPIGVTTVVDLGLSFGLDLTKPLSSAFHFSIQHATVSLTTEAPPKLR